jgi:hypothetical protein
MFGCELTVDRQLWRFYYAGGSLSAGIALSTSGRTRMKYLTATSVALWKKTLPRPQAGARKVAGGL